MRIDNEFEVQAPVDRVWEYLLDVEKVAPCVPGGELTETVDDHTWKGKVNVKMGPVSLSFTGTVIIEERDDANHSVVLKAEGREQRGKGAASARSTSTLAASGTGTKVSIGTDLTITGTVAQYGRGMVGDISQRLTREFAECLQRNIGAAQAPPPDTAAEATPVDRGSPGETPTAGSSSNVAPAPRARPVKGIHLGLWAVWRAILRFFRRLFGRPST